MIRYMSISTVGLKISRAWMDPLLWSHGRRHDELQHRPYDEIVMWGQFRTVAMSNIISREENMFGNRAFRHSVVIYL